MAEISFKRGYDVEPAPVKTVSVLSDAERAAIDAHLRPFCDRIACARLAVHPPNMCPGALQPAITYGMLEAASKRAIAVASPPPGKRFEKKCPLCNFVSDRIGSPPTFCVACDSPFEMKKEPAVHCAICNLQAPFVIGRALTSNAFHGKALVPDTDGWSRSFFPWPDKKWRSGEGQAWPESTWLCPKDATEVAKFIAHRREPMRTEYENL